MRTKKKNFLIKKFFELNKFVLTNFYEFFLKMYNKK